MELLYCHLCLKGPTIYILEAGMFFSEPEMFFFFTRNKNHIFLEQRRVRSKP